MIGEASGYLLKTDEGTAERSLRFTPSALARENYMYLTSAGIFTLETEGALGADSASHTLIYTISGAGRIEMEDRGCIVASHDGVLIRSGLNVRMAPDLRSGCAWQFMVLRFSGHSFPAYYSQLTSLRGARPGDEASISFVRFHADEGSSVDSEIQKLAGVIMMPQSAQGELIASTAIISLLTELIIRKDPTEGGMRPMPRYIEGIMKYINEYYRQQITLDELAAEFNVSKFHLSREFKKYTGYSPNEYVISVRLSRAKDLLRNTARTITEIAQITGSGDVNHFIQLFKSREKVTPAVFRRRWNREPKT